MSDPIRMLHLADLHIGVESYGSIDQETGTSSRVKDFLDRFDEAIDFALEGDVDLTVFAGDAFKSREPTITQQREFAIRIRRLAEVAPVVLVVGNHDTPATRAKATSVDIFSALDVANVHVGSRPTGSVIATKRGPVFMAWLPYPVRNRMLAREKYQGKTIAELEVILHERVLEILNGLAQEASEMDMPRVLAGHFSVAEADWGSERLAMLGSDFTISKGTLANGPWDYVALGHIHKFQDVNSDGYPSIVYPGSLERVDFGEEGDPKGFCWVELDRGDTAWKHVSVNARPFHTIRADVRGKQDPTAEILAHAGDFPAGSVVRVVLKLERAQMGAVRDREIREDLTTAGAAAVAIQREVEVAERARLGTGSVEGMQDPELLHRYLKAKGTDEIRINELLEEAGPIFEEVGE